MPKISTLVSLLAALLLSAFQSASALVLTNNISLALDSVRTKETVTNGVTVIETVERHRIINKDILGLLALATSNAFPSGSSLKLIASDSPVVLVVGKGSVVLADVSSFFSFELTTNEVRQSRTSTATQATARTTYPIIHFTFDDGRNSSFDVTGAAVEQYHASAVKAGLQKESGSLTADVAGTGVSTTFSVVKGKIKINGADTISVATP